MLQTLVSQAELVFSCWPQVMLQIKKSVAIALDVSRRNCLLHHHRRHNVHSMPRLHLPAFHLPYVVWYLVLSLDRDLQSHFVCYWSGWASGCAGWAGQMLSRVLLACFIIAGHVICDCG